jgi:hypothetical protein
MAVTFRPLLSRLRGRLAGPGDPAAAAAEVVEVAPAEEGMRAAARALPGQIDRVRATQPDTTLAIEAGRIAAGPVRHRATRALRFRDAHLAGGVLYAGGAALALCPAPGPPRPARLTGRLDRAALASSLVGNTYFGHHVVDDAATALLAARFAPPARVDAPAPRGWPHAAPLRAALGVELPALADVAIGEAWVFDDAGMTADRRARLAEVRARLAAAGPPGPGLPVYLRRRGGGVPRAPANEPALEEALARAGFLIRDPAADPLERIAATCRGAPLVAGVEGSALAHAVLGLAPGGALLVIQPPERFNNVWKDFTDALGLSYLFVVGLPAAGGYTVNAAEVLATVELAP